MATILIASSSDWVWPAELAKGFIAAGMEVAVVGRPDSPLLRTQSARPFVRLGSLSPARSLARALEASGAEIVIPCDDRTVWYLRRLYADRVRYSRDPGRVAGILQRSLGSAILSDHFLQRVALLEAGLEEGLAVPGSLRLLSSAALRAWDQYPAFVKMDGTVGGRGVQEVVDAVAARRAIRRYRSPLRLGWQVARMLTGRHAPDVWDWLQGRDRSLSIQARIDGYPANILVCCKDGVVLATIAVEVLETLYPNGPACRVKVVDNDEMGEGAARIVRRLGLSGFVGFDFIIEAATGRAFLIEMNPRPTGLVRFSVADAPDPIACFCRAFLGVEVPVRPAVPIGTVLALPSSAGPPVSSRTDRPERHLRQRGAGRDGSARGPSASRPASG